MPADRSPKRGAGSGGKKSGPARPRAGGSGSRSSSSRGTGAAKGRPRPGSSGRPSGSRARRDDDDAGRPGGARRPSASTSRARRDDERDDRRPSGSRSAASRSGRPRRDDERDDRRPSGGRGPRSSGPRRGQDDERSGTKRGRPGDDRRRTAKSGRPAPKEELPLPGQGAVARKGAAWLKHVDELDKAGIKRPPRNTPGAASDAWRKASGLDADEHERPKRPAKKATKKPAFADRMLGDDDDVVVVEDLGDVRDVASSAVTRGSKPARRGKPTIVIDDDGGASLETEVRDELAKVVPKKQLGRFENRLDDASRAFRRERFGDAARILKQLAKDAPGVASVRELYGLTLYREGKWRLAAKELEAFRLLGGSTEQHPVLADCYRALHQWSAVEELWDELRVASPSADLMVEGRIVTAGARADQGDVLGGIDLLEQGWKLPKRPKEHHLRRAYALADLYERVGEVTRARQLFEWIVRHDTDFADAPRRARLLGA